MGRLTLIKYIKPQSIIEIRKMYYFIVFLNFFIHILLFYPVIFATVKIINNPKQ